jgi:hypothetical protein
MSKSDKKISEALGMETPKEKPLVKREPKEITTSNPKGDSDVDYRTVRKNLHSLVDQGQDAIDGILAVAAEGDSPRAYEVAGQLIKTVADMNKDIMDLHKKVKEIKKEETTNNNTTNNAIYVGSTKELQELINKDRSTSRRLRSDDIIDVTPENNSGEE